MFTLFRLFSIIFISLIFLVLSCNKKKCNDPLPYSQSITVTSSQLNTASERVLLQDPQKISDTYLSSYYPNNNYDTVSKIFCWAWTVSSTPSNCLFLLKFDYTDIPKGKIIESARLSLFADTSNVFTGSPSPATGHYGSNVGWSIRRIETVWGKSSVSYNTRPISSDIHEVSLPSPSSNTSSYQNIDVTDLVQDQLQTNNYGFEVRLDDYTPYKRIAFYSSNSPYLNYIPRLDIIYK